DCFGGSQCYDAIEEPTKHRGFTYYWDQTGFDPVSNRALFYIHFKPKGGKKVEKVFTYDWRMWSIPELREILEEVGFKKTHVYWEGTTKAGEGDGIFTRTEKGESCLSWIAYIAAEK
ncbi:MAG: class I SAM-dependent methyltransferase, partial [Pseudobdellovibrionaceae bacterium]